MRTFKQSLWLAVVAVGFAGFATAARATIIIWSEDFSNVSDWQVIFDPDGGSSITSDGNLGLFHVPSYGTQAAFGPIPGVAPLVSFDVANKNAYTMDFTVPSLTDSTSYDIRLDQFDANTNYLSTIFGVWPQGTFTGTTNVALGAFSYDLATTYLLPKITVFTGNGDQTVRFDSMDFTVAVPEPSTGFLFVIGLAILWRKRPRTLLRF